MSKPKIDESGNKYGRLTVLYYIGQGKWHCKCDCGKEIDTAGSDLRRGHTNSCGCYRNEQARNAVLNDLTGQHFGFLQVLERDMNYTGHQVKTHWICLCNKCGQIKSISANSLHNGAISCGCARSRGEEKIREVLLAAGIHFIQEYSFPNHKNRRYDFAILNQKNEIVRLIEFDGLQHYYRPRANHWAASSSLEETQKRDQEKNQLAKEYNIPLVRIPYWTLEKINVIMLLNDEYLIKEE